MSTHSHNTCFKQYINIDIPKLRTTPLQYVPYKTLVNFCITFKLP